MEICAMCMRCLMDRQEERVRGKGTQEQRDGFLREVARIIAQSGPCDAAPVLVERINERLLFFPLQVRMVPGTVRHGKE